MRGAWPEHLNMPFYVVNFEREFEQDVIRPFVDDYIEGRTPIPCTHCNNDVKFDRLLVTAREIGAERIATGHYARVRHNAKTGRYELLRAVDAVKGPDLFSFWAHAGATGAHGFSAGRIDEAGSAGHRARIAGTGGGQAGEPGNLFRADGKLRQFIEGYLKEQGSALPEEPGDIVTTSGEILGRHAGLHQYTVGQRKGLGISTAHPMYVVSLDRAHNRLVVGEDRELAHTTCEVRNVNWIPFACRTVPYRRMCASAIVTNRATAEIVALDATTARVTFHEPQRAITPGRPLYFMPATKFWAAAGFGRARPAERAGRDFSG